MKQHTQEYVRGMSDAYREILHLMSPKEDRLWEDIYLTRVKAYNLIKIQVKYYQNKIETLERLNKGLQRLVDNYSQLSLFGG